MEKISIKIADIVLTPNIAFKELFILRGSPENKIKIVMNSPNENIFSTDNQNALSKKSNPTNFSIIYHGSIVERHGLYDALLAVKMLRKKIPNIIFNIYGDGDYVEKFVEEINKLELNDSVFFHGFLQQEKLVSIIQMADLGIIPNRRSPFTEVNLPTRILEYLCLSKPVIAPNTKGIRDYFDKDSLLFFNSGDPNDLADVIYQVYSKSSLCIKKIKKGMEVYKKYTWASQKKSLICIVSNLIEKKSKK